MRAGTHKEAISQPVCGNEARVWDNNQGLGVHEKSPAHRARRDGICNTGEFTVINVRQLLESDVHGGERCHQTKHDRRVSH